MAGATLLDNPERMRYLVIKTRADSPGIVVLLGDREPTVKQPERGVLVVEVEEADDSATLKIDSDAGAFTFPPERLEWHLAASPEGAIPIVISDAHVPRPSAFAPRVDPEVHAKPLGRDAVIAGWPGDGTPLPVNVVGSKQTDSFLATDARLGTSGDYVYGNLRQFETTWEPLGWALDQWISTLSLGPFEDTVESGFDVTRHGRRVSSDASRTTSGTYGRTASETSVDEAMRIDTEADLQSRGWSLGVGGPPKGAAASTNPLLALAQGLVGTFQLNLANATTSVRGGQDANLSRDVVNRIEQEASEERARNNQSLANVAGEGHETRRLRALRNLGPGRTENLALFSVVRQWLVTTVEAPAQAVILIRAHEIEKSFTAEDLTLHRPVLAAGLLDPSLADALAGAGSPPDAAEPRVGEQPWVTRVTGKLKVTDPAGGGGSYIRVAVVFDGDTDPVFEAKVGAPYETTLPFDITVDGPLAKLAGWRFTFVNQGGMVDRRTAFTPVDVKIQVGDSWLQVESPGEIVLDSRDREGRERPFARPVIADPPVADGTPPRMRQLLDHLNANKPYYRLLIDFFTDPVTRFVRLSQRSADFPIPKDLRPIGVAGAHLAFFTGDDVTSPGDEKRPIKRIIATPAGGTFVEVLEGRTTIETKTPGADWPTVALKADSTLEWPTPVELAMVEATAQKEAEPTAKAPDVADQTDAELPEKIGTIMEALKELKSAVDGLTPKAPEPPPAGDGTTADGTTAKED